MLVNCKAGFTCISIAHRLKLESSTYHDYNTYETYEGTDHGKWREAVCPPFPGGIIRFYYSDEEDKKVRHIFTCNQMCVLNS